MTNNTIPNVPRELLEELRDAANEGMNATTRQHQIDYFAGLIAKADALLSSQSPAGVDADHVEDVRAMVAEPVQQVSVPECYARLLKHAFGMTFGEDWNRGTAAETHRNKLIEAVFDCRHLLAAAPAAPAADAHSWRRKEGVNGIKQFMTQKCYDAQTDAIKRHYEPFKCANCKAADALLVEALDYQVLFDAIAAATSVYANGAVNISVQAFRDALAAHRAQGVV